MATAVVRKKSAKKAVQAARKGSAKATAKAGAVPAYKNASLPAARRTADLLKRMTLEEKAAQMLCIWQEKALTLVNEKGEFDPAKAKKHLRGPYALARGLGQVGRPSDAGGGRSARQMAELTNEIQKFFLENSRLGIPVIYHEECLHGHAAPEGTSFPQPIALAGTWNPELVERLFTMTALEARSRGAHHALTPVVDVAREPRWGRVEETYGEDPYLVSRMGIAAVKGFQGNASFKDKTRVLATLKHFVGHGQPESGMNCAPANVSERVVRETFLYTFREALREAGAVTLMASYNEIDGVPSHASKWLLREILRKDWGFKGFVVSDYYAIWELGYRPDTHGHFVAKDRKESAKLSVEAGVNIELPDPDCYKSLVDLVKRGALKERQLEEMVAPMLEWKFRLGLFDDPYADPDVAEAVVRKPEHRELALEAARESITLLKNDGGLAPLDLSKVKTIAVIGPNADRSLLGGYSGVPLHNVTVLEGIRAKAGKDVKVLCSEGCKITIGGSWNQDAVTPSDPAEDRRQIAEAVKVAKKADVIVLAIGGNEQTSREAWNLQHMGDRTSLDLIGRQNELIDALAKLGKPMIAFLFNGRPLSPLNLLAKVPVVYECWYLGQECGRAVADVLFGDFNPGGKLPISFPRSAGHLPVFYNFKPSARRGYLFDDVSPLFAFGYGLSYTTFKLENARLAKKKLRMGESTSVSVEVTNTGKRAGTETVQMYIRDVVSSVTRPVKELKGFRKVWLEPGETKTVTLPITPELLKFWDVKMKYVVEPGEFRVMVGTSSRDEDLMKMTLEVKG